MELGQCMEEARLHVLPSLRREQDRLVITQRDDRAGQAQIGVGLAGDGQVKPGGRPQRGGRRERQPVQCLEQKLVRRAFFEYGETHQGAFVEARPAPARMGIEHHAAAEGRAGRWTA